MPGDLADVAAIAAGADGSRCHVPPGRASWASGGPWEEFERGTVEGTDNALDGSRRPACARFVHTGTEAALMDGKPLVNADETGR